MGENEIPSSLWVRPEMLSALSDRDLGAVLRLVRAHVGWSQTTIAARTGVAQSQISPIMGGTARVKTLDRMEKIACGLAMPDDARVLLGLAPAVRSRIDTLDSMGRRYDVTMDRGESEVDRRALIFSTGAALGGSLLAIPADLGAVVRRRAESNTDDFTLDDIELTVEYLARHASRSTYQELLPLATANWMAVEELLDGWHRLDQRRRLLLLAGQLSYYMGRLYFGAGIYSGARHFAALTLRYSADGDDPVLRYSALALLSSIAFYSGSYGRAVDIVESGARYETRYTRARGLAYVARAHGARGQRSEAFEALRKMRAAAADMPLQVGEIPFGEASALLFTAGTLTRLGDGDDAAMISREAVSLFDSDPDLSREEYAHARLGLAVALATSTHAEPDEAAEIGRGVMSAETVLSDNVVKRLGELDLVLRPWRRAPAVEMFIDQFTNAVRRTTRGASGHV